MSFGEKIARLTDPTPEIIDPEDAVNLDSDNIENEKNEISDLRRRNAPLLEDVNPTYSGRKVSRRELGHIYHEGKKIESSASEKELDDSSSESSEEDADFNDDEIKKFKNLVTSKYSRSNEDVEGEDIDEESFDDEESSGIDDDEDEGSDGMTKQFSNINVASEVERAQAIKNQKEIWNRLLESRIKLQKLLQIINKLPQCSSYKKLKEKGGKELMESLKKASHSIKHMMKSWMDLQTELVDRNKEIASSKINTNSSKDESDEEIPSDTDNEMEISNQSNDLEKKGVKRKIKTEDCETVLNKHFKSMIPYRNSVIEKWDEKTRLATGKTQKSFSAFDNSALKQIEQNLQDKARLVRRTQLKRSLYRVLGKPEIHSNNSENLEEEESSISKRDMLLKDYDPEIFDDDDFYRQILKDVIESKSFGVDAVAIRKQMDIQKIRNKMKRKVDTKASKGRKLRFDVYPKLVNFLAQVQNNEMPEEARESFLKCIFAGMNS